MAEIARTAVVRRQAGGDWVSRAKHLRFDAGHIEEWFVLPSTATKIEFVFHHRERRESLRVFICRKTRPVSRSATLGVKRAAARGRYAALLLQLKPGQCKTVYVTCEYE